jgi:hypothetical protein
MTFKPSFFQNVTSLMNRYNITSLTYRRRKIFSTENTVPIRYNNEILHWYNVTGLPGHPRKCIQIILVLKTQYWKYGIHHGQSNTAPNTLIETPSNNKKAKYEPVQRHRSPLQPKKNIQYWKYDGHKNNLLYSNYNLYKLISISVYILQIRYPYDVISKLCTGTTSQVSPTVKGNVFSTEITVPIN